MTGPCIVPRCEGQPTRLYPGGRFCEKHAPGAPARTKAS